MNLVVASSLSYKIGELTALVVLAVLFVSLVLRVFGARSGTAGPVIDSSVSHLASEGISSTPPPGMGSPAAEPTPVIGRSTARVHVRRSRGTDAIAAVIVGAVLVAAIINGLHGAARTDPWATGAGLTIKTGFVDGCQATSGALVDCNCAFARITSQSPYNTPAGFETLAGPVAAYKQTQDLRVLPAAFVSAFTECRRRSS